MDKTILMLLVLCVVYINCLVIKGKAHYCRDPDTGKLHEVNTTWTATSFCGNYTCNLRRKNVSLTSAAPIREFTVTNLPEQINNTTEHISVTIEKKTKSDIQPILHKFVSPQARNWMHNHVTQSSNENHSTPATIYNEQKNYQPIHNCKKQRKNLSEENDRYLTEQEIDSIADLLHTVKRSDLDAIVDIYNLAQDIYKEMDEQTNEEIKNEAINIIRDTEIRPNQGVKTLSYWYDPVANKGRIDDRYDLELQNTLNLISTPKPTKVPPPRYFNGRLLNDLNKRPYYYPVTQFQRVSSYTNPTFPFKATTQNTEMIKQLEQVREEIQTLQRNNMIENNKADPRKLIQPSYYLPYPFANIHPYNLTESRNVYYGSPWMVDYYNRYKFYHPYYNSYIGPVQKPVLLNPNLSNEVSNVDKHGIDQPAETKATESMNERKEIIKNSNNNRNNRDNNKDGIDTLLQGKMSSNWKTNPVPLEVLKDIKADIDTSRVLKAFPLRKKIKLEKVGKLVNLDELSEMNRNKRFAGKTNQTQDENSLLTDSAEYETYLERVTCRHQLKFGYFRIGNLTQPFPKCCPQLIDTR